MLLRESVDITGCGRTDSGVHALYYIAHFDALRTDLGANQDFIYQLNKVLPPDIAIQQIMNMPNSVHARFDAVYREYEYHIVDQKNAFAENLAWYFTRRLDISAMNNGARLFLHQNDFGAFCKTGSDIKNTLCTVTKAEWKNHEHRLVFTIGANRFLRNMVRAAVGTLLELGLGKITIADLKSILDSGNRSEAGQSVPAHGLYLTAVHYPEHYNIQNSGRQKATTISSIFPSL